KQIDKGETPGPKIHVTGPYLEGAGSWALQMHQLTGPEDATKTVNFWLDQGVDNFKAYMFITPAELSAAVAAAHKRGAKVTGHLCSIGFREAASIGIDDLEHGLLVDTEFFPWKKAGECPEAGCTKRPAARHDPGPRSTPRRGYVDATGLRNDCSRPPHHPAAYSRCPIARRPQRSTQQQGARRRCQCDPAAIPRRLAALARRIQEGDGIRACFRAGRRGAVSWIGSHRHGRGDRGLRRSA